MPPEAIKEGVVRTTLHNSEIKIENEPDKKEENTEGKQNENDKEGSEEGPKEEKKVEDKKEVTKCNETDQMLRDVRTSNPHETPEKPLNNKNIQKEKKPEGKIYEVPLTESEYI